MPVDVTLLEDWRRYERSLLQKIKNREAELRILHEEYIELQRHDAQCRQLLRLTYLRDEAI